MAGGDCARWQDDCLDLQRTKGCPPVGPCPPAISAASGESSLSGLENPAHALQSNWSASSHSLGDGASPQPTDSASVGSVAVVPRNSESPKATAADDCQFIYDLFPEVVAEESKACGKRPLHLKLNHAEVLRALDRQNTAVHRPGSHVTSDMRLNFPTAKAALEVTCGLPTYDMDGAAASAPRPRRMCHAPSVMPIMAPLAAAIPVVAPASSLSCAVAPGKRSVSPQAGAGEPLSCHASPTGTAALQHSRASSTSSAAFSSSYLQANMVPASSGQLTPTVPGSPAALSHSASMLGCLQLPGDGGSTLDGDLGDLVASFQKDGGQEGLGPLFLSDSDDASDGTQLSLGRMWGGADVFDGIFDDVDAMDSESYGSHFDSHIPDCSVMPDISPLASALAARGCSTAPAFIMCEALSSSSNDSVLASPPLMGTTADCGASGLGLLPVVSCGDLIHHGLGEGPGGFGVNRTLSITHGGAMPAIPRCASTLLLQHIPTPVVAALPELPASLVQIPAKTNECAKSARQACFAKCKEKRHNRQSGKIRYEMRKINAEKRPRIKGRFVKREELAVLAAAEQALGGQTAVSVSASLPSCDSHPAITENAPVWA